MIKMILLIRRKAGISREEFIHHYEAEHVPLVTRHFGAYLAGYTRNYVDPGGPSMLADAAAADTGTDLPFDVITELAFEDRDALRRMTAAYADPAIVDAIVRDEERFVDRASVRIYTAEARQG